MATFGRARAVKGQAAPAKGKVTVNEFKGGYQVRGLRGMSAKQLAAKSKKNDRALKAGTIGAKMHAATKKAIKSAMRNKSAGGSGG